MSGLLSIRYWCKSFGPTSDEELAALLAEPTGSVTLEVATKVETGLMLSGHLTVPWGAHGRGVVTFAHGAGSGPLSAGNRNVAYALNEAGFATLVFNLLTTREARDRATVFGTSHRPDVPDLLLLRRVGLGVYHVHSVLADIAGLGSRDACDIPRIDEN